MRRIRWAEHLAERPRDASLDQALLDLARWIGYFQHERLIHLLVTCLFALLAMLVFSLLLWLPSWGLLALLGLILVLLIPYIRHYYLLENGVQRLYLLYDRLQEPQGQQDDP